ncbi:MAG TPA: hypothetical protein VLE74_03930 [Candidatus Saccharimonadales bacterium]|nr:hypothetical protein [Candidatus Saccharimonadales bacterium]
MAHEHNGECCGQAEASQTEPHYHEYNHEHHHNLAGHIGAACCSGACNHPEHMLGINFLEAQQMLDGVLEEASEDENDILGLKKKKKRSNYGKVLLSLKQAPDLPN